MRSLIIFWLENPPIETSAVIMMMMMVVSNCIIIYDDIFHFVKWYTHGIPVLPVSVVPADAGK
jgi:hypothetical protein